MKLYFLLLLFLLVLSGCDNSLDKVSSTDLSQEQIAEITLDMTINDKFRRAHGDLILTSNTLYDYFKLENGLEIACKDNKIIRIVINSNSNKNGLLTNRGITIGSTLSEVKIAYGNDYYKRSEQGAKIIGYHDKKHKTKIEFWSDESMLKVQEIRFDKDYVE